MKIFISHHIGKDEKLASILLNSLKRRGISGYMAERKQEYELLILDKIKNEIENSDYLVAILTKHGIGSASIHEEIGYAIGADIPVILMVEESIDEQGVLIHGKEPEYFTRNFFETHAEIVCKHILSKGIPPRKRKSRNEQKKEKDQYQHYSPEQRIKKLKSETIQSFNEHRFYYRQIKLRPEEKRYDSPPLMSFDLVESKKRNQRIFFFCFNEIKDANIEEINLKIRNYIFANSSGLNKWLNVCFIIIHESVSKTRIANYYNKIHYGSFTTVQNTLINIEPSILYYGLGQGSITFALKNWNFSSSVPKFFIHTIKSKNDLLGRIGIIEDFIDEQGSIFTKILNLKKYEEKYQTIPREKAKKRKELLKKKRERLEIRREKRLERKYLHRPSRRYGYSGNPAYYGIPKD